MIGDKGYTLECTYFNECSVPIKFDFMYGEVGDVPVGGKYTRNSVGLGCFPDHPFKPYRWFKLYCGDYRVDVIDRPELELFDLTNYDLVREEECYRRYEYTFTDEYFEKNEYDCYTCLVNLDEDEMRRFITGDNYNCPYFRNDDEYELARKQ